MSFHPIFLHISTNSTLKLANVEGCTHFPGMNAETGKSSKGVNLESAAVEVAIFFDEEAIFDHYEKCEVVRVGFASESKSAVSKSKILRIFSFEFRKRKEKARRGRNFPIYRHCALSEN